MNFGELIARIRRHRGSDSTTEESTTLTYIKETINGVYREVLSSGDQHFMVKEVTIHTTPSFVDGTLVATNGLNIMTLSDTATYTGFDYRHWGGKLQVDGEDMYYGVVKTSLGDDDPHYVYLDRPFLGTTSNSLGYSLYRESYPLPSDFMKVEGSPRFCGASSYKLSSMQSRDFDNAHPHVLATDPSGDPTEYSVWQRKDSAWFTATATLTNGGYTATLTGDSTYFGLENWRYRVVEDGNGERYRVLRQQNTDLSDNVVLEFDRPYGGSTSGDALVKVDPRGSNLIQFWPPPSTSQPIVFKYQSDDFDLVNDADEPVIPEAFHDVIWKGALYYMAMYDGELPIDTQMLYKRNFDEARGRLRMYHSYDRSLSLQRGMWGGRRGSCGYRMPDTIEE